MNRFYKIPEANKKEIFQEVSSQTNLPAYAVEKDWWVVQTLAILFETDIGKHLVFKGGTSLSKALGLIERFSEDVDLAVDRSFFGFKDELSKSQRTKLRKASNTYITETLFAALQQLFQEKGLTGVRLELEEIKSSDQDPVIISVYYPNVIESPGYIQARVQIEIGCRSLREPFENKEIISLVDEAYPDKDFTQEAIQMPTVLPQRTFLEKIFLLHEEFQRPKEKIRVDRLSRHLYDIYQLSQSGIAEKALKDKELYKTIVKHRYSFTRLGGVDYNLHQPQSIDPIPPAAFMSAWEEDYKTMQEQMIHGVSPDFKALIKALSELKERINNIDWKMDCEFPAIAKDKS